MVPWQIVPKATLFNNAHFPLRLLGCVAPLLPYQASKWQCAPDPQDIKIARLLFRLQPAVHIPFPVGFWLELRVDQKTPVYR